MGQRYYEVTMPKIADQLERLNKAIEGIADGIRLVHRVPCGADAVPEAGSPPDTQAAAASAHAAPGARLAAFIEDLAAGYARVFASGAARPMDNSADVRSITAAALEAALRAAFRMGVAAGQLATRQDAPARERDAPVTGA